MARRRPRIVPADIKRQTHGFAESPFVIFENLRARKMSHHFLIRGSGCVSFAHHTLRSGISNRPSSSPRCAHLRMRVVSATVVPMKLPSEGGVNESLASKIGELLPAHRAQMPKNRIVAFGNFMVREVKRAALRECELHIWFCLSVTERSAGGYAR